MQDTHSARRLRDAQIAWMDGDEYTHAITLNTDRELSLNQFRRIFGTFCRIFDHRVHQVRNMRRFPTELRLRAIVFPENLTTNAHLHGFVDFTPAVRVLGNEVRLFDEVRYAWRKATRGAGSFCIAATPDKGWGAYSTKQSHDTYFLAADYHPS